TVCQLSAVSQYSHRTPLHTLHHTFFFQAHRTHRDLHSFPTRRSSDLSSRPVPSSKATMSVNVPPMSAARRVRGEACCEVRWPVRSEEHTSELQSLRHLVCRLLLEKKKKQKIETISL